jgi:hypothetical protein
LVECLRIRGEDIEEKLQRLNDFGVRWLKAGQRAQGGGKAPDNCLVRLGGEE